MNRGKLIFVVWGETEKEICLIGAYENKKCAFKHLKNLIMFVKAHGHTGSNNPYCPFLSRNHSDDIEFSVTSVDLFSTFDGASLYHKEKAIIDSENICKEIAKEEHQVEMAYWREQNERGLDEDDLKELADEKE